MSQPTIIPVLSAEEFIKTRHSVRNFKRDVTIPADTLNEILELASAAPSAWNLQHWRFLVIQEQAQKDLVKGIAYGQQQVSDASVVVVVLGDLQANLTGHQIYNQAVDAGELAPEVRDTLLGQIDGAYKFEQVARDEALKNAGLASMQLMLAAKAKGYDSVPMGGYDKDRLIEALKIPARYLPVMIIPIGEAASPGRATGRITLEQSVIKESF
ncbi:putative NAD(P)H nitroreductase YodC [Paenibacillus baekrokdamisoli]|uniref:Putative NAD(P)H nitroreductase YodC n=1 Tax=Paenibacillus baekrokdamisoli TaxID=1712516 RepID=A0A3G9J0P5_9BACL|nr:nitroreductase family protein [Paenibacillus baekrokdamisoli]MBB3072184.1 nitroreductase [Paenibacillus baekrokdamisoli]BBH24767.1 putative NAD(P)H nitroreductase YodC [Paenibacillus baekrokdamisoli]